MILLFRYFLQYLLKCPFFNSATTCFRFWHRFLFCTFRSSFLHSSYPFLAFIFILCGTKISLHQILFILQIVLLFSSSKERPEEWASTTTLCYIFHIGCIDISEPWDTLVLTWWCQLQVFSFLNSASFASRQLIIALRHNMSLQTKLMSTFDSPKLAWNRCLCYFQQKNLKDLQQPVRMCQIQYIHIFTFMVQVLYLGFSFIHTMYTAFTHYISFLQQYLIYPWPFKDTRTYCSCEGYSNYYTYISYLSGHFVRFHTTFCSKFQKLFNFVIWHWFQPIKMKHL